MSETQKKSLWTGLTIFVVATLNNVFLGGDAWAEGLLWGLFSGGLTGLFTLVLFRVWPRKG